MTQNELPRLHGGTVLSHRQYYYGEIVKILDMNGDDIVVKIGAGLGIVTAMIARQARMVTYRPKI